jgi:hypothetical protein
LFVELTLVAILLAAIRLIFVLGFGAYDGRYAIVVLLALFAVPVLLGAVIGGLFGNFLSGVLWGGVAMVGLFVSLGLLYSAARS